MHKQDTPRVFWERRREEEKEQAGRGVAGKAMSRGSFGGLLRLIYIEMRVARGAQLAGWLASDRWSKARTESTIFNATIR